MNNCTIYLRHDDPIECIQEISVRASKVGLEIHPLVKEKPGDKFSQLILGTHNFIQCSARGADESRSRVLKHIAQTTVIVGVPRATDSPLGSELSVVAGVVLAMDAIIFDGTTMRDHSGADLLT